MLGVGVAGGGDPGLGSRVNRACRGQLRRNFYHKGAKAQRSDKGGWNRGLFFVEIGRGLCGELHAQRIWPKSTQGTKSEGRKAEGQWGFFVIYVLFVANRFFGDGGR